MRIALVVLALFTASATACRSPGATDTTRVIVGIVIGIDSGIGFGKVESFTVKQGGEEFEIFVDPDIVYDFPLAHLNSHRAGAEPVRVEAATREGKLVAISIADA